MTYQPKLDPERDLKGATPEKLARALFRRNQPFLPSARRKSVVSDKVGVEKVTSDKPSDSVSHLGEGV